MSKAKHYKSGLMASIHESVEGLHHIGVVDKTTMRDFDNACLLEVEEMTPETIKEIRESEHVSQPVFAAYLNVSKGLVSDWERGIKKPGGPALRLLSIVRKNGLGALL